MKRKLLAGLIVSFFAFVFGLLSAGRAQTVAQSTSTSVGESGPAVSRGTPRSAATPTPAPEAEATGGCCGGGM